MRVALFGGTGFVGSYLVDALVAAGHDPALLVRPGSEAKVRHVDRCRLIPGHISDDEAVAEAVSYCDAVIYNIGILREFPDDGITFKALQYDGVMRVAERSMDSGVKRFLLMSANGVKPNGTPYQETKYLAERFVAQSEMEYTIFRPSIVFGDPRGRMEFCTQLRDEMIRPPIPAPNFYTGKSAKSGGFSMSPVHVRDVAEAFVRSLPDPTTYSATYPLCGPEAVPWPDIIRRIAAACGRRKLVMPAPAGLVGAVAAVFDRFPWFPVTRDQLTMLMEGNTGDSSEVFADLGIEPTPFGVEQLSYLR
ncbi:MAG: NAD(P)H-binding protein [Chromatiales bacterium]|jgi:NADH dehydrogenase|nr:NAD(P)H-binding protein [Chromatiales bacterium]